MIVMFCYGKHFIASKFTLLVATSLHFFCTFLQPNLHDKPLLMNTETLSLLLNYNNTMKVQMFTTKPNAMHQAGRASLPSMDRPPAGPSLEI